MCLRRTLTRRLPIPIRCAVRSAAMAAGCSAAGCSAAAWVGVRVRCAPAALSGGLPSHRSSCGVVLGQRSPTEVDWNETRR